GERVGRGVAGRRGRVRGGQRGRPRRAGPRRGQPLPRRGAGHGAGPADDLGQPPRRGGRAAARPGVAEPRGSRREPRLARAMNVRPATREDAAAVAGGFAAVEEELLGRPSDFGADAVQGWWQTIAFQTNTWLFEEDGVVIAGAGGQAQGDRGNGGGAVRPCAWGRGLGTRLIELVEGRLAQDGAARVHSWALAADERASELFRRHGYHEARRFWEMAIEFDDEPA